MKRHALSAILGLLVALPLYAASPASTGMRVIVSENGFDETVTRIEHIVKELGPVSLMAKIDHRANAARVGLDLPPTTLLVFGNPRLGTRLMQASRRVAIDLPMKMLVWQEGNRVYIGWNEPDWLAARHGIGDRPAIVRRMAEALGGIARRAAARAD